MVMNLYSVFDCVAEESGPLFEAKNDGVALRKFEAMFQSEKVYSRDDYKLLYFGSIDHDKNKLVGTLDPREVKVSIEKEVEDANT